MFRLSNAFLGSFLVYSPSTSLVKSDGDLPKAAKDESYEAGHYVVTVEGEVKTAEEGL